MRTTVSRLFKTVTISFLLTIALTNILFGDSTYTVDMTPEELQVTYDAVLVGFEDPAYTPELALAALSAEQEKIHALANELRKNEVAPAAVASQAEVLVNPNVEKLQELWLNADKEKKIISAQLTIENTAVKIETIDELKTPLAEKAKILVNEQSKLHQAATVLRTYSPDEHAKVISSAQEIWVSAQTEKKEIKEEIAAAKAVHRYSKIAASISQEEIDLIAKILYLEARGESNEGQRAVVEVIFNRVNSNRFPNTVTTVAYARNQFTTVKNLHKAKPTAKEYNNIQAVLDGGTNILSSQTVYFSRSPMNGRVDKRIENHVFCKI